MDQTAETKPQAQNLPYDKKFLEAVSEQIRDEFKIAEKHIRPWREMKRKFFKLYLNQRKDPKKVGDTLLFSTHQTILASLYKDRLDAEWMWREEEDTDRAEAVNALWEFDYDEMGKAQHDYGKYWDASFYGISFEDWTHFDRGSLTPIPDLWDPMSVYIDPRATSINGNMLLRGASRFLGRDILRTKLEMLSHGGYFNLEQLDADEKKAREQQKTQAERDTARGLESGNFIDVDKQKYYPLLQWFTYIDSKRYLVEAGNEGNTIVRLSKAPFDYWQVEISRIYPDPHVFLTPGVPDFTEDKQRARAILQNYTLDAAKLDVLPMWLFDKKHIKNKQQLRDWKAGKVIEGEDINANTMFPLTKPSIHQFTDNLMNQLELNAQKALATPEIQQGMLFEQKRTATEIAQASANVDTRYSLTASLFSQSEQNTAYMWYDQYKKHFKAGIDKKTVRIVGAFGPKAMPITQDTFKFKRDPDVKIESRYITQAKKKEQRANMAAYGQILLTTPGSNIRYFAKKFGRLMFPKDEVDRLLPPTIDEMRAEDENDKLNANTLKGVQIEPTDDHKTHLEIHSKAADTKAKFAHIEAHKKAMMMQRNMPELFAPFQQSIAGFPPGGPATVFPQQAPPKTLPAQTADLANQ